MYALIKPLLFRFDAEKVHHFATGHLGSPLLKPFLCSNPFPQGIEPERLATEICGIPLKHPVGLAAGFDKDAKYLPYMNRLGFGHVEIGTVTAKAQAGNPKPRLFRLPKDQALINRMGFNNDGADAAKKRLAAFKADFPVGGNIGKSKVTPLEKAHEDYAYSMRAIGAYVDYFVVNVSSPNTPNLRNLQAKEPLTHLLDFLNQQNEWQKPILLKIAPDLTESALEDVVEVVKACRIRGVIANNTTIDRAHLRTPESKVTSIGAGGLSGKPLKSRSLEVLSFLRRHLPPEIGLVGVGGIFTGADVVERILAGADCVQIYSSFVYRGPKTVAYLLSEIAENLHARGLSSIKEAVGKGL